MSKETTTPKFDLFRPERIDLTSLSPVQKEKLLKLLGEYLLNFDYVQHLEDCFHISHLSQDYSFELPVNFHSSNKHAINLHQMVIDVVNAHA